MTDEADSSVVLAELQVALFRECNNQRLSPWSKQFSCSPTSFGVPANVNTMQQSCTIPIEIKSKIEISVENARQIIKIVVQGCLVYPGVLLQNRALTLNEK